MRVYRVKVTTGKKLLAHSFHKICVVLNLQSVFWEQYTAVIILLHDTRVLEVFFIETFHGI